MNISIRPETAADYRAVEELTREAFWGFTSPDCDEHYLVHLLRDSDSFIPQLDLVAEINGRLAGNIMYTKAKVIDKDKNEHHVITFGPLSVLPPFQMCGVGSALMHHSLKEAKCMGFRAVIIYGHPDYYPRFGFRPASDYYITAPDGKSFHALMALPLYEGALDGITGAFHEDSVFHINAEQAAAYNRLFPHKPPSELISIDVLLNRSIYRQGH